MTLVPLLDKTAADPQDLPVVEAGEQAFGQVLNTWRAILHRPGLFAAYLPFLRGLAGPGALDQRVKELVAIEVARLNHCRYTTSHRCTSGKAQGLDDADFAALASGDHSCFTPAEQVALTLARELTLLPAQTPYGDVPTAVPQATLDAATRHFEPAALVELTLGIGIWNALARFHRVMGLELDMPAPPPALDAVV